MVWIDCILDIPCFLTVDNDTFAFVLIYSIQATIFYSFRELKDAQYIHSDIDAKLYNFALHSATWKMTYTLVFLVVN
jgi:hypothetical protein